ncbi:RagB/SusD family nutrient uptake outer membrane protein [uncultured Bacteroides sp.]|uniref:RagB/SusD family nutrient uptake outer membrane protein n=1 Tax=uncultured Bacteroides sp. TaxID=162156 RepID=UPI002AA6EA4A|nr:RagB/SusD family nutrient uptake outer membrane protein [uncultured Bacteroides sp.]
MKKILIGSMFAAICLLSACSLDETPESKFSEEDAYQSSVLIYVNTVASIYSSISNGLYGATDCVHTLQEFTSDATMLPGRQGDWVDGGKWQNMFLHNFASSVDTYSIVWNHLYQIIGLCNSSIDKLEEFKATNEDAESYIYEVRALRAIYYYYAMDLFAQVPIVTSSSMSIADVSQSNRSDVFKFVTSELEACLPYLSEDKAQNSGSYYGRVTKAVAYMCMAKCALNAPVYNVDNTTKTSYQAFVGPDMSKECIASESLGAQVTASGKNISITVDGTARNAWSTVVYCVEQIEKLGYQLQGDYADNFIVANQNSIENIFTRPDDDATYKIWDCNLMRSLHYNHGGAMGYSGWNGTCSSVRQMQVLHYGLADQDPRLAINFYTGTDYTKDTNGVLVNDGATTSDLEYEPLKAVLDFPTNANAHDVKSAGARFKKYEYDASSTIQGDINNDLVIWRYGDALLMKAEAEYRLGETGLALGYVKEIRDRAGATQLNSLTLNDILNERMAELSWEGVRRQDQIRFCTFTQPTVDRYVGIWHNASAGDYNNDTQGYTNVFPIPYSVLNLNSNLKQNPGY